MVIEDFYIGRQVWLYNDEWKQGKVAYVGTRLILVECEHKVIPFRVTDFQHDVWAVPISYYLFLEKINWEEQ